MYLSPNYCAYYEHKIAEIVVRSATIVSLSCKSCCTKYYQCHYCYIEAHHYKKYHIFNQNSLSRNTQHNKNARNKKIPDTLDVPVANEEQDHIDSLMSNNDDNDISDASLVEESTIESARQYDFDFDCVVDYFKLLKIHSDKPT